MGKKEVKLSLFADTMIIHVENLMEYTKKLLELINGFSKVARCKVDIQKSIVFLYIHNEQLEIEKTILLKMIIQGLPWWRGG